MTNERSATPQRYELDQGRFPDYANLEPSPAGDWVKWEDVRALFSERLFIKVGEITEADLKVLGESRAAEIVAARSASAPTDLVRELREAYLACDPKFCSHMGLLTRAAAALDARSATGDMERDAKRYRWLRTPGAEQDRIAGLNEAEELDAAIDAAMDRRNDDDPDA